MATYNFLASQCPAIPAPTTALQNRTSETPLVYSKLALGDSIAIMHKGNQNAVLSEIMGRYGSGAYAILTGLGLSIGSGLNVTVAAGQALIDAPRTIATATDVAVPNAIALGSIWMTQAGTLTPSNDLTAPAGNVCYLGLYTSAGGVVTVVDESGTLRFGQGGGIPMRQTADTGCPTDTPTAGVKFLNKCVGGLYYFDGVSYHNLTDSGISTLNFSSDANKTLTAAQYSSHLLDFVNTGTALTATRDVILPLTPAGRRWLLRNNSNGGQSLRGIGASGTGITIATTKYAEISADGTNIIRITPDT
jgi:hypothetical protein